MEIESLQCIYLENELKITREKPYSLEIILNSNPDDEEKNFLRLKVIFDLRPEYPDCVPQLRIKNLCSEYLSNNAVDAYENELKEKAEESIGGMMLYELCEHLKEKIVDIND